MKLSWQPLLETPWNAIWRLVWNTSERVGIGLGRFAPFVFNQAMGMYKRKRISAKGGAK